jgi:hypothetical protein
MYLIIIIEFGDILLKHGENVSTWFLFEEEILDGINFDVLILESI